MGQGRGKGEGGKDEGEDDDVSYQMNAHNYNFAMWDNFTVYENRGSELGDQNVDKVINNLFDGNSSLDDSVGSMVVGEGKEEI